MKHLTVFKDNSLIEASYKLSLIEQRVILYALAKINPKKPQQQVFIDVYDYVKLFSEVLTPNQKKNAYKQLKQATSDLFNKFIIINNSEVVGKMRWISYHDYKKNNSNILQINFTNEVMPYLFQLGEKFGLNGKKKGYTKYQLTNVIGFKSVYSIRIYEIIRQLKNTKHKSRTLSFIELRSLLLLDETSYKEDKDITKRIIKPSVKEINKLSDININLVPVKESRKIVGYQFILEMKQSYQTTIFEAMEKDDQREKEKLFKQQLKKITDQVKIK